MRGQRGVVADHGLGARVRAPVGGRIDDTQRQGAAIDRERTREDKARAGPERAAGVEHRAGAVEIDVIAEIGVGLGLAADHGGEMKHRTRSWG